MNHQPIIVKKKKAKAHAVHHGGSWKVAYADFVTAMMAFFMVMWIMGLSDETRAIVAGYFNDPMGFMKNQPRSKTVIAMPGLKAWKAGVDKKDGTKPVDDQKEVRALEIQIEKSLKNAAAASPDLAALLEHVQISITDEGLRMEFIEAAGAVFFETGSAIVRPGARRLIASIAPVLRNSERPVVLEGHTDAAPYTSTGYDNWDLGGSRANAFRRVLAQDGIRPKQFREVRSYADTHLLMPEDPMHFSNRRVSLLLPFYKDLKLVGGLPKQAFNTEVQGAFNHPVNITPPEVSFRGNPVQVVGH
jgi:chemotaxis protein MotB